MGLNIKSDKAHRLAKQLSRETGETMTTAIEKAEARYRRIRQIVAGLPPVPPGVTSDHSDLYDEDGLPA